MAIMPSLAARRRIRVPARAFIDYFLGDESMKVLAKMGEFVNRRDIYPPLADADKIQFVPMHEFSLNEYAEKEKEFQKLFGR